MLNKSNENILNNLLYRSVCFELFDLKRQLTVRQGDCDLHKRDKLLSEINLILEEFHIIRVPTATATLLQKHGIDKMVMRKLQLGRYLFINC